MDLKQAAKEQVEKAKQFNRKPPKWAYWVVGIGLIIGLQLLLASVRS
jgi:hypothetical protein